MIFPVFIRSINSRRGLFIIIKKKNGRGKYLNINSLFRAAISLLHVIILFIYSITIKKSTKKTVEITKGKVLLDLKRTVVSEVVFYACC